MNNDFTEQDPVKLYTLHRTASRMLPGRNAPIGIFDSGVGGLTVTREVMRQIPEERIVYFGDTARVPYGSKSRETVIRYSRQNIRFLKTRGVKAIVIACNTASAHAIETVAAESDIPIIGVIYAGAKTAVNSTKNKKVGIIGTAGTVASNIYPHVIGQMDGNVKVYQKACPLFVPLAEEGMADDPLTREIAARYLQEIKDVGVDTLVLGCTHYPLLRSVIREAVGENVTLVNPAYETALELKALLKRENLLNDGKDDADGKDKYEFYVSDLAEKFTDFANSILPNDVTNTKKIEIEEY